MTLDRRVPGVYIDVEDRSLVVDTVDTGRVGYIVLLSDRGRHNQVVELNSRADLYEEYGYPDFMKYGQAHYLAEKFLTYSSRLFVVRPVLLDPDFASDTNESECMAISNVCIRVDNIENPKTTDLDGVFSFTSKTNIITYDSTSLISIGDWICPYEMFDNIYQIIDIDEDELKITLDKNYVGESIETSAQILKLIYSENKENSRDTSNFDTQDDSVIWYFYAIGAGSYYNPIFIKGVRNTELEKMYTDDDGNPLYPNLFMDITFYRYNDDSTISTLEGPYSVSLVDRLPGGQIIKNIFNGEQLYLPTVINRHSKKIKCIESLGAKKLMTTGKNITYPYEPDSVQRLMVQSLFAKGTLFGLKNIGKGGIFFGGGEDGNFFNSNGMLNFNTTYQALVSQAYLGELKSVDGTIELISQSMYPLYKFDYILCGGYTMDINNSAREMVDVRGDCLLLSDPGEITFSADEDLTARREHVPWNTWNAALYVMYREIFDNNTGKRFYISPVYHAIERHLYVDSTYWLSEPVAGIEKGAISDAIVLAYKANLTKLGDLIENEMNPVISEPDGIYILTQFSCWKRLSIMKRLHAVKFIHFIKKIIPSRLKDILQRKATPYWLNQCTLRINGLMNQYLESSTSDKHSTLKSYSSSVNFDDVRSEINVVLSITFIRAIERINVSILVN